MKGLGESVLGSRAGKCKGPEARASWVCWKNHRGKVSCYYYLSITKFILIMILLELITHSFDKYLFSAPAMCQALYWGPSSEQNKVSALLDFHSPREGTDIRELNA